MLLLNPKTYVIIALMFTQFLSSDETGRVLATSATFTLNNLVAFTLWTLIEDRLATRFRAPHQARRLNRALAVLLASVAIWMAWP